MKKVTQAQALSFLKSNIKVYVAKEITIMSPIADLVGNNLYVDEPFITETLKPAETAQNEATEAVTEEPKPEEPKPLQELKFEPVEEVTAPEPPKPKNAGRPKKNFTAEEEQKIITFLRQGSKPQEIAAAYRFDLDAVKAVAERVGGGTEDYD